MVFQECGVVYTAMVGSEEGEVVALTNGLVEIVKEVGESFVQSEVAVFRLYGIDSHLMADIVGA